MLTLTQIQQILEKENLLREFITPTHWTLAAPFDKNFQKSSYDSRKVDAETLFFCKGNNFQQRYLEQALTEGLTCYIAEQPYEVSAELAIIVTDIGCSEHGFLRLSARKAETDWYHWNEGQNNCRLFHEENLGYRDR